MNYQRVELRTYIRVPQRIRHSVQYQHKYQAAQRGAEGRRQQDPENADRGVVQQREDKIRHSVHDPIFPSLKAFSRNAFLISAYFPRGTGISVMQDIVTALWEILRIWFRFTR